MYNGREIIFESMGYAYEIYEDGRDLWQRFVYVNCFREKIENPSALAVEISDRHFGVGSDGLIMINPSDKADFEMEMYNADGSHAEKCAATVIRWCGKVCV